MKKKLSVLLLALTVVLAACGQKSEDKTENTTNSTTAETNTSDTTEKTEEKTFTVEELSKFNGKNGEKAYVAVNGTVYDVTNVEEWKDGEHYGVKAGTDATDVIGTSPHGEKVLEKLPVVGKLAQ